MSSQPTPPPPTKKSSLPLPVVIGVLVVALVAVFFVFLKPMLFPTDENLQVDAPTPIVPTPAPPPTTAHQPASAPPTTPTPVIPTSPKLTPNPGEIVVNGTLLSVKPGGNIFTISATSIVLPGKGKIALVPPRSKTIMHKINPAKYKPGSSVSAVGPNEGKGTRLVARKLLP